MALNAGIILQGQQPDIVGAMQRGQVAGQQANEFRQQNALNGFIQQNGAAIMGGDQNALNALSQLGTRGFDAAQGQQINALNMDSTRLGMDQTRLGMDATRQNMQMDRNQDSRLTRQEERQIQQHAMTLSAEQRAKEAAQIEQAVTMGMAAQSPEQWDAIVGQSSPDLVGQFENREMIAGKYMSIAEVLKRADGRNAPPEDNTPAAIQTLRIRAQEAGLMQGTPEYQQFMADGGTKKDGITMTTNADGSMRFTQGNVSSNDASDISSPSSPAAMSATIDGILNDPAFDTATGILSLTQKVPGTGQYRFGTRVKQLEGQAFLQAFESLKGAGQITEIEGTKATQAIGRLDSSQSPDDFRQALTELNDILKVASGRPIGWSEQKSATPNATPSVTDQAGYDAIPSGTVFMAPDGTQRRKP